MGKATRWIKGLLGMKKEKEKEKEKENAVENKKRFSFGKYGKESNIGGCSENIPVNIPARDMAWLKSYMSDSEKEQNKHAIAVAAATAAAADAAVAAAQAAVAVVRLTSKGNNALAFNGGRERWAAVKIQTVFRGYLARKALRALKGLVKIQALVRGYLVRKRAAATLHSMQALIRAQTAVRSQRARRSFKENRIQSEFRHRKSIERFDDTRSEIHSKRISISTSLESPIHGGGFDESPKIVEIDTFKPRSRSRRYTYNYNAPLSESGDDYSSYQVISSPLLCPKSARITIPTSQNLNDYDWCFTADELKFPTAQSTPRFANSVGYNAPPTPAKSVCGDGYFRPYSNCPSYMANTQSFKAKLRSLSAPKQRPEPGSGPKKKLSLNEIMAARNSISSIRMQRPSSIHAQDGLSL